MRAKSFFKLLFTFIIIFALAANTVFAVLICTSGGSFFGYEFSSASQLAYINAMLLGVDKGGYRTDVIILAQLNLADSEINMLQIPRDTYVNSGRSDHKINSAYGYNKEKQVFKEVGDLLDIEVDKYILIDTAGFRDLIDTIGGVDFEVPINMDYDDPVQDLHIHLKKGMQHLDGDKAEQFVRFRKNNNGTGYALGDIERMQAQSKFIQATIDEIFNLVNVFKINDLVKSFSKLVKTNFTLNEMLNYAPYIFAIDRDNIKIHQFAGESSYRNGISYVIADDEANAEIIDEYFTPSTETVAKDELEIREKIIGVSGTTVDIGTVKTSKSILNRFSSVDIIDASGGNADVSALEEKIKDYGFNLKSVSEVGTEYPETTVVSKSRSSGASRVAALTGLGSYICNKEKSAGADITVILGTDYR